MGGKEEEPVCVTHKKGECVSLCVYINDRQKKEKEGGREIYPQM